MNESLKARRLEIVRPPRALEVAHAQGVIAQAMPFLEQQEVLFGQRGLADVFAFAEAMAPRESDPL